MARLDVTVTYTLNHMPTERSTDVHTDSPSEMGGAGAVIQHSEGLIYSCTSIHHIHAYTYSQRDQPQWTQTDQLTWERQEQSLKIVLKV